MEDGCVEENAGSTAIMPATGWWEGMVEENNARRVFERRAGDTTLGEEVCFECRAGAEGMKKSKWADVEVRLY